MTSRLKHEDRKLVLVEFQKQRQREGLAPKREPFVWAKKKRSIPLPKRRLIECRGVKAIRGYAAEPCGKLVMEKGRTRGACPTCYVLRVWRERFAWVADCNVVVGILAKLAAQGRLQKKES